MKKLNRAFTLIELMIVVAIIAILGAIAAPKFGEQIKIARDAKGVSVKDSYASASGVYHTENEKYATSITAIQSVMDSNYPKLVYSDLNGNNDVNMEMYIPVGKASIKFLSGNVKDKFALQVSYSSTDGAFSVEDTGTNTRGEQWSKF